ncbi:diacylglycerol kinase [Streptomyces bathyalis]|uniref:Diacylglycerol kinase n=1 Tax=Streptomyces bathyalis TaxID=2710756 RepID=A0A7T1WSU6_9ACTN|nr:diacylglycerol kinase [Streptomyces bathyalis]QPP07914.1 diacylglycerol kinase [Streptomyces bathyalis]
MSAPDPAGTSQPSLLLVIDPVAKLWDGESVRIARDVLCAGASGVKVCLPESPEETERALARRGSRRPVVVGDDRALLRAVRLLHRERELEEAALSVVPVGREETVALMCGLGVPVDAVSAARTVLDGAERRLGLLMDDSGGVVLGGIRIPGPPCSGELPGRAGALRAKAALSRARRPRAGAQRLRVEADGELLADLDRPVTEVSVFSPSSSGSAVPGPRSSCRGDPDAGSGGEGAREPSLAQVTVLPQGADRVQARAKAVTVSGPDFRYRADVLDGGPVRVRTWTALAGAWSLTLPA